MEENRRLTLLPAPAALSLCRFAAGGPGCCSSAGPPRSRAAPAGGAGGQGAGCPGWCWWVPAALRGGGSGSGGSGGSSGSIPHHAAATGSPGDGMHGAFAQGSSGSEPVPRHSAADGLEFIDAVALHSPRGPARSSSAARTVPDTRPAPQLKIILWLTTDHLLSSTFLTEPMFFMAY